MLGVKAWVGRTRDSVRSACGNDLPLLTFMARSFHFFPSVSTLLNKVVEITLNPTVFRGPWADVSRTGLDLSLCTTHVSPGPLQCLPYVAVTSATSSETGKFIALLPERIVAQGRRAVEHSSIVYDQ